jgi:glycine/D-amino acid oxidase-like deaminating enzyme
VRTSKGTYFGRKLVLSVGAWAVGLYGKAIPQAQLYIERRVLFWFKASEEAVEGFKVRALLFSFSCCSRP